MMECINKYIGVHLCRHETTSPLKETNKFIHKFHHFNIINFQIWNY